MTHKEIILQTLEFIKDKGFINIKETLWDKWKLEDKIQKEIKNLLWKNEFIHFQSGSPYTFEITTKGQFLSPDELSDDGTCQQKNQATKMEKHHTNSKIFISHSSKDAPIVKKFIDHVLKLGLGITNEEIFCTSADGIGVKSGEDFKKRIYEELKNAKMVIQILTKNYRTSEICLNEMGAAWVLSSLVVPIISSIPFQYDIGFLNHNVQQLKINQTEDLQKLYDDHKNSIFIKQPNIVNFNAQIAQFLEIFDSQNRRSFRKRR
jgi:hypothetical protein